MLIIAIRSQGKGGPILKMRLLPLTLGQYWLCKNPESIRLDSQKGLSDETCNQEQVRRRAREENGFRRRQSSLAKFRKSFRTFHRKLAGV
jgi:hypothetical protein